MSGELADPALHPELIGLNLIGYLANGIAEVNRFFPGVVTAAIAARLPLPLPRPIQRELSLGLSLVFP